MRSRVRERAGKLSEAVRRRATVRPRKRVQKALQRTGRALSQVQRRNVSNRRQRLPQAQSFIRAKEERLVAHDWPTKRAAEIVEPPRRLREVATVGKPVSGVKDVVAEEVKQRAMKLIRSFVCGKIDIRTGQTTELRLNRQSSEGYLLYRG